jgi:ABC-type sugar transport system ATPase subunit
MALIELENVVKRFGPNEVVSELNLIVPDGSFTVLLGPSGCGKTTTLQMIAGLELVSDGIVCFDGADVTRVPPHKRDIAMVFQSYALYPNKTVYQNMAYGLKIRHTPQEETSHRVNDAATMLSITDLLDRKPATLSGGQRQRVAVGRAVVRRPRAFLLDEPLSNVDAKLRAEMRVELRALQQRLTATFVYVTHDQLEAMTMADQIAVMNGGVLQQVGTPEDVYSRPASRFVAEFIGSPPMNLFTARIKSEGAQRAFAVVGPWSVPIADTPQTDECTVGVHFEDVTLTPTGRGLDGTVLTVEHLGAEKRVLVQSGVGLIGVRVDRASPVKVGDRVGVNGETSAMHVFDGQTGRRLRTAFE